MHTNSLSSTKRIIYALLIWNWWHTLVNPTSSCYWCCLLYWTRLVFELNTVLNVVQCYVFSRHFDNRHQNEQRIDHIFHGIDQISRSAVDFAVVFIVLFNTLNMNTHFIILFSTQNVLNAMLFDKDRRFICSQTPLLCSYLAISLTFFFLPCFVFYLASSSHCLFDSYHRRKWFCSLRCIVDDAFCMAAKEKNHLYTCIMVKHHT